mgnify:CR=1 FL=1
MKIVEQFSLKKTDKNTLKNWYYLLTLGRMIDDRAPNYLKQALGWSYHAPCAGHDAIQMAIGLNFDRVWEGTMSDIYYSPEICRNIMVDLRYVLFIVDKFAGAQNLIKEMKIISAEKKK